MDREPFCSRLGFDLVQAAKNELDFLRQVDEYPADLYKGPFLENAIIRYEVFWLPLASKEGYGSRFLAAPLDIAWVWHVHMLAPFYYEKDCINCVSKIVDHAPLGGIHLENGIEKAKYLWETEYPDEPFEVDASQSPDVLKIDKKSKIQYDLEEACYRQSKFYYQVSLPHYKDTQFLEKAVERYEHHLHLTKENPGVFLVPCYDFDLIWHVHQLHPVNYNQKTKQFLGRLLHHDDTATSRSPGSKLNDSEAETRKIWKAAGLQFTKSGAMHRGVPPDPLPPRPMWLYASLARCEYTVDVLQVETFNMGKKTFYIQLVDPEEQDILSYSFKGNRAVKNLNARRFTVDNDKRHTITALIYQRRLLFKTEFVTKSTVSLLPSLEATSVNDTTTTSVGISFCDDKGQYTAQVTIKITPPNLQKYSFKVKIGTFFPQEHPSQHLSNPQLVLPPSDLSKKFLPCSVATESVLDWRKREAFKYRIVHSSAGLTSAVEIINLYQQVVASAHTINSESLPEKDAVRDANTCIVLDPAEGERAMLIRGQKDWAVCVAKWEQQIEPGFESWYYRFGKKFVKVKIFKLYDKHSWCAVKKSAFGNFVIKMDPSTVIRLDLRKNKIFLSPHAQALPEAIVLSMSVAILHLLCIPYLPKQSAMESSPSDQIRGTDPISPIFHVAGYSCRTVPTNTYIKCASLEFRPPYNFDGNVSYDFNKDEVFDFNAGPEQRSEDSDGTSDTWEGLAAGETDDDQEGVDGSLILEGGCGGENIGYHVDGRGNCDKVVGSVCGASGGYAGGDGKGC